MPAVGISIGVERTLEIMDVEKMFPEFESAPKVLVALIGNTLEQAIEIAQKLRAANISADLDLMRRNIGKLMNYANTLQIPYVVVIGENELKENKFTLRNMKTGKQELLSEKDLIKKLK